MLSICIPRNRFVRLIELLERSDDQHLRICGRLRQIETAELHDVSTRSTGTCRYRRFPLWYHPSIMAIGSILYDTSLSPLAAISCATEEVMIHARRKARSLLYLHQRLCPCLNQPPTLDSLTSELALWREVFTPSHLHFCNAVPKLQVELKQRPSYPPTDQRKQRTYDAPARTFVEMGGFKPPRFCTRGGAKSLKRK